MAFDIKKIISKNRLIHNFVSFIVNLTPDFIEHNFSKYKNLRNCILNLNYDKIEGDYVEFGCFSGASLNHSIKTHLKFSRSYKKEKNFLNRKFYGLDSFSGFPEEIHDEFKTENFLPDINFVKKLEKKYSCCQIVKGFFSESLKSDQMKKISKISLAFIDCDLYSSSKDVFDYIKNRLTDGAFVVIDDYYSLDYNKNSIHKALSENIDLKNKLIHIKSYGLNGMIFRYIND